MQKGRSRSHHTSRLAASVRNALHRKRRGHSDCFPLAWTQGRRRAGNENLRPLATRAQHRAGAARHLRTSPDKAGRRDRVSGNRMTVRSGATARKEILFFDRAGGTPWRVPPTDRGPFVMTRPQISWMKRNGRNKTTKAEEKTA